MFPQLRKIEQQYGQSVVIVGVHSPKFPAERETSNLREAVLRYRIEHPVVNDRDFEVWHRFGGRAWPTLMFLDPEGRVIGKHEGELPFEQFDPLVKGMLTEFEERGLLDHGPSRIDLTEVVEPDGVLRFPGKVLAADDLCYVADTNHHRILVTTSGGSLAREIGSGLPGLLDGSSSESQFQQPQGMALTQSTLYVADTENHAVRAVDLGSGRVRTLAGTGAQRLEPLSAPAPATTTALSSPWDLALQGRTLYIAMAGTHQVWTLDLDRETVAPFAGTGREGLLDGPLLEAWFAQPSGLALSGTRLYVADSEVSAVREIDLPSGSVRTIVGEDLFVFGDQDGEGDVVRLQHPLGITAGNGALYLADSYNNKVKRVDPATRQVTSWLGSGVAGDRDGAGEEALFREPGGLCATESGLFIADTNNHRIVLADWRTSKVRTIVGPALRDDQK